MKHAAAVHSTPISKIIIRDRHRRDMGDLSELAASIERDGLLQPIGITEKNVLVFGERRLRAVKDVLKKSAIETRVVHLASILAGEYAENELRKDFTPSERVAIAEAVRKAMPERRGKGNPPMLADFKGKETRDIAAQKAGFTGHTTYEQARRVVTHAVEAVVKAMDSGKMSINAAAKLSRKPKAEQERVAKLTPEQHKKALQEAREKYNAKPLRKPLRVPQEKDSQRFGGWLGITREIAKRELPPDQLAALMLDGDPDGQEVGTFIAATTYMNEVVEWIKRYEDNRIHQVS